MARVELVPAVLDDLDRIVAHLRQHEVADADARVDAVDWVERIPFAETRNYVQRIMENLQVYRARFGGGNRLTIEADIKRGGAVVASEQ